MGEKKTDGTTEVPAILSNLSMLKTEIENIVTTAGGILRCETCGQTGAPKPLYMSIGWPRCHNQTMRWWTQKQLDAGEMPEFGEAK